MLQIGSRCSVGEVDNQTLKHDGREATRRSATDRKPIHYGKIPDVARVDRPDVDMLATTAWITTDGDADAVVEGPARLSCDLIIESRHDYHATVINHCPFHSASVRRHRRRRRRRSHHVDLLLELKRIAAGFLAALWQHVEALYNDTSRSAWMRRVLTRRFVRRHAAPCLTPTPRVLLLLRFFSPWRRIHPRETLSSFPLNLRARRKSENASWSMIRVVVKSIPALGGSKQIVVTADIVINLTVGCHCFLPGLWLGLPFQIQSEHYSPSTILLHGRSRAREQPALLAQSL